MYKYILFISLYKEDREMRFAFDSYMDAVNASKEFIKGMQLTRHNSVDGPVCHMNKYFNLFNELSIMIKGYTEEEYFIEVNSNWEPEYQQ
jgi:hypothetical protein